VAVRVDAPLWEETDHVGKSMRAKLFTAYSQVPKAERASGRQALALLWSASRVLTVVTGAWVLLSTVLPTLVVIALGLVVAAVPGAVAHGLGSADGHRLIMTLVLAAVVYAVSLVLNPVGSAIGIAAKARITSDMQARLMGAVSGPVGVGHLENTEVLDRLARAEGSLTGYFPGDAPVTLAGILASRASGVLGCVTIAVFQWWLGIGLLVMWLAVRRYVLRAVLRQATDLRGQTVAMRRAWYLTGVGSKAQDAKEVRVFGLADFIADQFRAEYRDALSTGVAGLRDLHRRALIGFVIVFAGYATAMAVIAYQAHAHTIDLASVAILLPMLAVTMSAGSISTDDITLTWTLAGIPDVTRLESELAEPAALSGTEPVGARPERSVRFESVGFRYPTGGTDVLSELDLDLAAGTSTAIVGVNGAGKSTLVSLLSRLRDPTAGRITVDGTDVRELDPADWQRRVALMPQDPVHYPATAYDNIVFGAIEHADDRDGVRQVAETAGFLDVLDTLPKGWDTVLSRELPDGVDLSGGQWQRLALARALFATRHGATLLVLDEPTAALDIRGEARFYQRFFQITEGLTTVVISHRFATVRKADVICVLDGGRITERGSHDELVAAGGTYADMYQLQASRFGGES
jgi:ATP-binding cassette subfamily B protein